MKLDSILDFPIFTNIKICIIEIEVTNVYTEKTFLASQQVEHSKNQSSQSQ